MASRCRSLSQPTLFLLKSSFIKPTPKPKPASSSDYRVFSHIFKASSSVGFSSVSATSSLSGVFSSAHLLPRH